jgi:hypothetical protein
MQITMQATLLKEDILQAIADFVSKETGREVSVSDIQLSQEKISADVNIGAPADKTEAPKAKKATKTALKAVEEEPEAEQAPEEDVAEEKTEEVAKETPAEEPAPAPKKSGSIFNFASEG